MIVTDQKRTESCEKQSKGILSPMKRSAGTFLVCDSCGYCCMVRGQMASSLAGAPPTCPGCSKPTRIAPREPWREELKSLDHAS
jgi:hypothetical protein